MTLKTISIREDIYKQLKHLKNPKESFSELIERLLLERRKDPLRYLGIAKDEPEVLNDEFEMAIVNARTKK